MSVMEAILDRIVRLISMNAYLSLAMEKQHVKMK